MKLWPQPKLGDRLKITVPTDHFERFMTRGLTTEPDSSQWENVLAVWRSDGQTDVYATMVRERAYRQNDG